MSILDTRCQVCGAVLTGATTTHKEICPFYPISVRGLLAQQSKQAQTNPDGSERVQ